MEFLRSLIMNRTIEINGTWFVLNFMDKDIDVNKAILDTFGQETLNYCVRGRK